MRLINGDFKQILFSQFISIAGGLIAGTILAIYTDKIFLIPGMLVLFPGFLEMRNAISGSLTARIGAGLHLGYIKPKFRETHLIKGNIISAFVLTVITSLVLGLIAFLITFLFFKASAIKIIYVSLFAGSFAGLIEIPLTVFFTFYVFRKGYDPDNVMGPFITSVGDVVSTISLLIAIIII